MQHRNDQGALQSGSVLKDKYRIVRVLGRGGFAQTYLAEDLSLNQRAVAIKEYLPSGTARVDSDGSVLGGTGSDGSRHFARGRGSFVNEANALAGVRHTHVVNVLERFEALGTAYLVLAFEPGHTLEERLNGKTADGAGVPALRIDATLLIELGKALLGGLEAVHRSDLVHGDIKPANIILRQQPKEREHVVDPVLIDFGAARGDTLSRTATIMAVASAGYSPPEQYETGGDDEADGDKTVLKPASDLYALGATLYRVATGQIPVVSTKRQSALFRQKPDPLLKAKQAAPAGRFDADDAALLDWIDSLMEVDIDKRTQSASAALTQLLKLDRVRVQAPTTQPTRAVAEGEKFSNAAKPKPNPKLSAEPALGAVTATTPGPIKASNPLPWVIAAVAVLALGTLLLRPQQKATPSGAPTASTSATVEGRHTPRTVFRDVLSDGSEGPEMVVIPAGQFMMGCVPADNSCQMDEMPRREQFVKRFAIGVTELTAGDYSKCVLANLCRLTTKIENPSTPMVEITTKDAADYVAWLSAETGEAYRLPTEAEWEFAARGGKADTLYWWGNSVGVDRANCFENSERTECGDSYRWKLAPVKTWPANDFGLYEVHGNAHERVSGCWSDTLSTAFHDRLEAHTKECEGILRGGAFPSEADEITASERIHQTKESSGSYVWGLRVARDL